LWEDFSAKLNAFDLHAALQLVVTNVDSLNRAFNDAQPWKLTGADKIASLSRFAECLRHVSLMLLPFIPGTAQKMALQLGLPYADSMLGHDFVLTDELKSWHGAKGWQKTSEPSILFPPLEKKEA
jgi:methionyl-tRNA synthetase